MRSADTAGGHAETGAGTPGFSRSMVSWPPGFRPGKQKRAGSCDPALSGLSCFFRARRAMPCRGIN